MPKKNTQEIIDKNSTKVRNYVVYGEQPEPLSPAFVHCQQMEVTGASHNWHIRPHIHSNLFQIMLFEQGQTFFTGEQMQLEISGPGILTIPENTLHEFRQENGAGGTVISISYPLLEELLEHYPKGWSDLEKVQLLKQTFANLLFDQAFSLGRAIDEELKKEEPGKAIMIRSLLGQLLVCILRIVQGSDAEVPPHKQDRNFKHFKAFQNNIKRSNSGRKQIREYARELQINPEHLNRICHSVAGKSALQVAQDHLVLEARRHLLYSACSISEIAHKLDFASPNYFGRFFKKATGCTPREFRLKGGG